MSRMDRDALIADLEALGSEDEEEVMAAAGRIAASVEAAGAIWDELLVVMKKPAAKTGGGSVDSNAAPDMLLQQLLNRDDLSEETRAELETIAEEAEENGIDEMDERYLRALADRM